MAQEGADWTTDLLDRLDHYIDLVRSNTTDRLVKVARLLVFGLLAGIVGATTAVVALIAAVRFLNVILPSGVWLPYLILGAIFVLVGMFAWRKANAPAPVR
ncbi:MAG TPA: phage holin family protein [Acidimicrobiales bacterium]|jgi:hypothetical protein|nr:phage holin family protein [Acidimicrobiales bacterium]